MIDQYVAGSPPEGWPIWCERQIREADFVICICTKTFWNRVEGYEKPGQGMGVGWESQLMAQQLYDAGRDEKYIPALFSSGDADFIPLRLRGASRVDLSVPAEFGELCRLITKQPRVQTPKLKDN